MIKDKIKSFLKLKKVQSFICFIMSLYIKFVYKTSRVKIHGFVDKYLDFVKNKKATFVITWHGRIIEAPMIVRDLYNKIKCSDRPCVLNSKHRDGQIASKTMNLFGFKEIFGSTINRKKLFQAVESGAVKSIMIIMREIKSGSSIHLAPDGPRGPIRKINSEVVSIAKKTRTPIFPVSINYSFKKQLKTWDEFQIALPFGFIDVEYLEPIFVDEHTDFIETNLFLENIMNEKMVI